MEFTVINNNDKCIICAKNCKNMTSECFNYQYFELDKLLLIKCIIENNVIVN